MVLEASSAELKIHSAEGVLVSACKANLSLFHPAVGGSFLSGWCIRVCQGLLEILRDTKIVSESTTKENEPVIRIGISTIDDFKESQERN